MTEYQLVEGDQTVYRDGTIKLHTEEGFEGMRAAGRLAATILDEVANLVQPGVTTESIDTAIREMMLDGGSVPATLGYRGYTHSCCISINHVICHGIPGPKVLKDGDILNVDVTPLLNGWHGDTSRMFFAGEPSIKAKRLVDVTYECLMLGIDAASKPGARLGDIGAAIEAHAKQFRYGVVREFCGHGLGRLFHDAPEVVHAAKAGTGPELKPGMFFTIEPMINLGKPWAKVLGDGWTAVTRDKSLSAQFEHSDGDYRGRRGDISPRARRVRISRLIEAMIAVTRCGGIGRRTVTTVLSNRVQVQSLSVELHPLRGRDLWQIAVRYKNHTARTTTITAITATENASIASTGFVMRPCVAQSYPTATATVIGTCTPIATGSGSSRTCTTRA